MKSIVVGKVLCVLAIFCMAIAIFMKSSPPFLVGDIVVVPGPSDFLNRCVIKSGSGLGTRIGATCETVNSYLKLVHL